jgi:hypothetical protein
MQSVAAVSEDLLEGLPVLEPREELDCAILGVITRQNGERFVVYDQAMLIGILGPEMYWYNTAPAWIGVNTPAYLEKIDDD